MPCCSLGSGLSRWPHATDCGASFSVTAGNERITDKILPCLHRRCSCCKVQHLVVFLAHLCLLPCALRWLATRCRGTEKYGRDHIVNTNNPQRLVATSRRCR